MSRAGRTDDPTDVLGILAKRPGKWQHDRANIPLGAAMNAIGWAAVAAGGALGAVTRYGVAQWLSHAAHKGEFPWATLLVNVVGTAILATLAGLSWSERGLSPTANLLLGTGFCGALTTFSTFSVEAVALWRAGHGTTALAYVGASLALCFAVAAVLIGTLAPPGR